MGPKNLKNRILSEIRSEMDLLIDRVLKSMEKITEQEYSYLNEYVTRIKAAEILDVSLPTLTKLSKEKKLKVYFISNKYYFLRQELLELINNNFNLNKEQI